MQKQAIVKYIPNNENDNNKLHKGLSIIGLVHLEGDIWPNEEIAWNLVVDIQEESGESKKYYADVRFLHENAPVHELYNGRKFKIFNGKRFVLEGAVQ